MNETYRKLDLATRRAFLSRAAQTCFGVSMLSGANLALGAADPKPSAAVNLPAGGKAKSVIYLFMEGAMSHLDTFDLKPETQGSDTTRPIDTKVSGIRIAEYFEKLAPLMDQVALVNSLYTATGAHDPGRYLMRTSYEMIATTRHPSMGPWAQQWLGKRNKSLPDSVVIAGGSQHPSAGYMETRFSPLPIADAVEGLKNAKSPDYLAEKDFQKRLSLIDGFDKNFRDKYNHKEVRAYSDFYKETVDLLKSKDLEVFDISKEDQKTRDAYGNNRFGQGVLLARRLIEADVRFVEVVSGGWDDHNQIYDDDRLPSRVRGIDQTLSALIADLSAKGLLQQTLIVVATEFGRTPKISQTAGRDHHPAAFSSLLAGGGIKGGQVYGKSDKDGMTVDSDGVTPAGLNATIAHALGLPLDKEFISGSGRPFKVAHDGKPIAKLF